MRFSRIVMKSSTGVMVDVLAGLAGIAYDTVDAPDPLPDWAEGNAWNWLAKQFQGMPGVTFYAVPSHVEVGMQATPDGNGGYTWPDPPEGE